MMSLKHYTRLKLHEKWESKCTESVSLAVKQTDIGSTTKSMLKLDVKQSDDYLKAVEIAVEFEARA